MTENVNSRRDFFRATARWVLVAVIAAGGLALVRRHPEDCLNAGLCQGCVAFESCNLPEAWTARRKLAKG